MRTYADSKFLALSPMTPSGQALWLYLMTGPHTTAIPGLFSAGRAGLAEALGWSQEDFDRCWSEIEAQGMARANWKARLVYLPNAIRHNMPESPNVVISWRDTWPLLGECSLKWEAHGDIKAALSGQFFNEFVKACVNPAEWKASAKPSPIQEQDVLQAGTGTNPSPPIAVPARATPPKTEGGGESAAPPEKQELEPEPPEGRFEPDYDQPVDNSWVLRGGVPQKEPPSNAPGWRRVVGASYERCFGLALAGRPLMDFGAFIDRGVPAIRIAEAIESVFSAKPRPRVPLAAILHLLENTPAGEPIRWKTRAEIEAENEKPVTVDKPRLVWTP